MEKNQAYKVKRHGVPVKRYVRTLDLRNDPSLIAEYCRRHAEGNIWPEIPEGIRSVGILEMEVWMAGTRAVMIVETAEDFDWDEAMTRLSTLPRQQEWEDYMAIFQQAEPGATSAEKWRPMHRVFHLYE